MRKRTMSKARTFHLAQQSTGTEEQEDQQQHEGDGVLVARADIAGCECLQDAEQQPAERRANRIAETADDAGDEPLDPELQARVVLRERYRRDDDPSNCAEYATEHEADGAHGRDTHADEPCSKRIHRTGPEHLAEIGVLEEDMKASH